MRNFRRLTQRLAEGRVRICEALGAAPRGPLSSVASSTFCWSIGVLPSRPGPRGAGSDGASGAGSCGSGRGRLGAAFVGRQRLDRDRDGRGARAARAVGDLVGERVGAGVGGVGDVGDLGLLGRQRVERARRDPPVGRLVDDEVLEAVALGVGGGEVDVDGLALADGRRGVVGRGRRVGRREDAQRARGGLAAVAVGDGQLDGRARDGVRRRHERRAAVAGDHRHGLRRRAVAPVERRGLDVLHAGVGDRGGERGRVAVAHAGAGDRRGGVGDLPSAAAVSERPLASVTCTATA